MVPPCPPLDVRVFHRGVGPEVVLDSALLHRRLTNPRLLGEALLGEVYFRTGIMVRKKQRNSSISLRE